VSRHVWLSVAAMWTSTPMSTRVSTPLVRAPRRSSSWLRPVRTPEPSRSAQPRRPTCRATDLDGSGRTPGHNGRRRTARAGLNAIHPCVQATSTTLEVVRRVGGAARITSASVCIHLPRDRPQNGVNSLDDSSRTSHTASSLSQASASMAPGEGEHCDH
jgi:hypothetical protein